MAKMGTTPMDVTPQHSDQAMKLIRKLRWIGREEVAEQLLLALREIPPDIRSTVAADQACTD